MRSPSEAAIAAALVHLTAARDLLKLAKCRRALPKVRAAITSTQGAERHARGMATREQHEAQRWPRASSPSASWPRLRRGSGCRSP